MRSNARWSGGGCLLRFEATGNFAGHTGIGIKKTKPRFEGSLNVNLIPAGGRYSSKQSFSVTKKAKRENNKSDKRVTKLKKVGKKK